MLEQNFETIYDFGIKNKMSISGYFNNKKSKSIIFININNNVFLYNYNSEEKFSNININFFIKKIDKVTFDFKENDYLLLIGTNNFMLYNIFSNDILFEKELEDNINCSFNYFEDDIHKLLIAAENFLYIYDKEGKEINSIFLDNQISCVNAVDVNSDLEKEIILGDIKGKLTIFNKNLKDKLFEVKINESILNINTNELNLFVFNSNKNIYLYKENYEIYNKEFVNPIQNNFIYEHFLIIGFKIGLVFLINYDNKEIIYELDLKEDLSNILISDLTEDNNKNRLILLTKDGKIKGYEIKEKVNNNNKKKIEKEIEKETKIEMDDIDTNNDINIMNFFKLKNDYNKIRNELNKINKEMNLLKENKEKNKNSLNNKIDISNEFVYKNSNLYLKISSSKNFHLKYCKIKGDQLFKKPNIFIAEEINNQILIKLNYSNLIKEGTLNLEILGYFNYEKDNLVLNYLNINHKKYFFISKFNNSNLKKKYKLSTNYFKINYEDSLIKILRFFKNYFSSYEYNNNSFEKKDEKYNIDLDSYKKDNNSNFDWEFFDFINNELISFKLENNELIIKMNNSELLKEILIDFYDYLKIKEVKSEVDFNNLFNQLKKDFIIIKDSFNNIGNNETDIYENIEILKFKYLSLDDNFNAELYNNLIKNLSDIKNLNENIFKDQLVKKNQKEILNSSIKRMKEYINLFSSLRPEKNKQIIIEEAKKLIKEKKFDSIINLLKYN